MGNVYCIWIIVVSEICLSYYNCVEIVYWFEIEEL